MPKRVRLDEGLQALQHQIITLGVLNEHALLRTLDALETGDYSNVSQTEKDEHEIGMLCAEAEHLALRLLILQQPLAGQDMRFLTAALYIVDNMKRISSANAQSAVTLLEAVALYRQSSSALYAVSSDTVDTQGALNDVFILRGLQLLGKEVHYILRQSTQAFTNRDTAIAHTIGSEHDLVEMRYAPLCQDVMTMQARHVHHQQSDPSLVQRVTYLLWVAHKLAEVATSVTAICQRTIYIVEGS